MAIWLSDLCLLKCPVVTQDPHDSLNVEAEFERFVCYYFEHEPQDVKLMVMAVVSRCLGGARSSDLLALDWRVVHWESQTIRVERQKTRGRASTPSTSSCRSRWRTS